MKSNRSHVAFCIASIGIAASLFSVRCAHAPLKVREPASIMNVVSNGGVTALSEIIGGDSPLNPYRRKLQLNFYTNGDREYLAERARKSFQEAMLKTLGGEAPEQGLAKIFGTSLKDALIENFVATIRVFKIVNMGLQFDFSFVPEPNRKDNFESELDSGNLVRLSDTGRLSRQWAQLENSTVTGSLYGNSTLVPRSGTGSDFIGGTVTAYIEILDTGLNPRRLFLPSPLKNGVKGYIRYRRYYRLNQDLSTGVNCAGFSLTGQSTGAQVPQFFTVDLYKNFNLANLIPTEETIEVFPGLLASTSDGRQELPRSQKTAGQSIETVRFTVSRKRPGAESISFGLKRLVYDLEKKRLDVDRSDAQLIEITPRPEGIGQPVDTALSVAKRTFLSQCGSPLATMLDLKKIIPAELL